MKRIKITGVFLVVLLLIHPLPASTEEKGPVGGTVQPYLSLTTFSLGDLIKPRTISFAANSVRDRISLDTAAVITSSATSFTDAFLETGLGVEFTSHYSPRIDFLTGVVYRKLNGKSFNGFRINGPATISFSGLGSLTATQAGNIRVSMDDASEWGGGFGLRYYLHKSNNYSVYTRGSLGFLQTADIIARISLADQSSSKIRVRFFNPKLLFYGEGGLGAEYRWGNFEMKGEVRLEWIQKRQVADAASALVFTDSVLNVPVVLGVVWRF